MHERCLHPFIVVSPTAETCGFSNVEVDLLRTQTYAKFELDSSGLGCMKIHNFTEKHEVEQHSKLRKSVKLTSVLCREAIRPKMVKIAMYLEPIEKIGGLEEGADACFIPARIR